MDNKYLFLKLSCLLLCTLFIFSCRDQASYIPPKVNLSQKDYDRYIDSLKLNRAKGNKWREAIYLANLFADEDITYESAMAGVDQDRARCFKILTWDSLATNFGFEVNLYANMPTNWPVLVTYCKDKLAPKEFERKRDMELNEARLKREKFLADSALFDRELMSRLDEVYLADQYYREQLMRNPTDSLWELQNNLDSVNLAFVDSLLTVRGWPGSREIGEHGMTLWLVLHHQSSIKKRRKYIEILQKAEQEGRISKSLLKGFMDRTRNIEQKERIEN